MERPDTTHEPEDDSLLGDADEVDHPSIEEQLDERLEEEAEDEDIEAAP
jgi:hypothetical protein